MRLYRWILILLIILPGLPYSESADFFSRTISGSADDTASAIIRQGSKIFVAGTTNSFGAGNGDIWIVKLDSDGEVLSEKTYGTSLDESGFDIKSTAGQGVIVLGSVTPEAGNNDILLLKLDKNGAVEWQKKYGGSGNQVARSVGTTRDRGFIVAGSDESTNNIIAMKVDKDGNVEWQKSFDHPDIGKGYSIQQTRDRGYILSGTLDNTAAGSANIALIKLDKDGDIQWQKSYGPSVPGQGAFVRQISRGYILTGSVPNNGSDIWALKLDKDGDIIFQKAYGDDGTSEMNVQVSLRGSSFILIGKNSAASSFVMRLKPSGELKFQREFANGTEGVVSLDRLPDGSYIMTGTEGSDIKLFKTSKGGQINSGCGPTSTQFVTTETSISPGDPGFTSGDTDMNSIENSAGNQTTGAIVNQDCSN